MNFIEGDWTFAPAGVGTEVRGFLTWMDPGLAIGANLTILWYQREPGDTWTTWAWSGESLAEASAWVAGYLGSASIFSEDPALRSLVFEVPDGADPPAPPSLVVGGLFVEDPAQSLVEGAEDPVEVMELLALNGWTAAPELSAMVVDSGAPCAGSGQDAVEAMLDQFALTVEETFFGQSTITLTCVWPCGGCTRTFGPWTPGTGPWTLVKRFPSAPNTDTCEWSRPGTRTCTKSGKTRVWCHVCSGACPADPGPETARTTVFRLDPCVPPP